VLAGGDVTRTTLIGAGILLGGALVLGPIFCGYVCPLGLVLDLNQSVRRVFRRRVLHKSKPRRVSMLVPEWIRYALLGGLVAFVFVSHTPVFQTVSPINLLVRSITYGLSGGLIVVSVLVGLEWFLPRVWCRALCPLGAVYSLVGRVGLFRVRVDTAAAGRTPCRQCTVRCPMGIPVMEEFALAGRSSVTHPACIRCGDCVDVCPGSVLRLGFGGALAPRGRTLENGHQSPSEVIEDVDVCMTCGGLARDTVVEPGAVR